MKVYIVLSMGRDYDIIESVHLTKESAVYYTETVEPYLTYEIEEHEAKGEQKIYLVACHDQYYELQGVYATREQAEKEMLEANKHRNPPYEIEERAI